MISVENFKANRNVLNRQNQETTLKPGKDFWSVKGDFIYRHHIKPRVQLHVPKGETFPSPLKYIDVTRSKHTNLDVLQENRIDDCWNVDANPGWLQEFTGNLVDDGVPERRDSHVSSSHEASLEPTFKRREDLCKHSVYTHFPKDRNCEICQRIKITRAPCRRRNWQSLYLVRKILVIW